MKTAHNRFWLTFYRGLIGAAIIVLWGPRREENRKTTGEKGKRLLVIWKKK